MQLLSNLNIKNLIPNINLFKGNIQRFKDNLLFQYK